MTLLVQYIFNNFDTRLTKHLDSTTIDFGIWIAHANNHARNFFINNQLCTRRCFSIMGTGLQVNIKCRFHQQILVVYRANCIHLGMRFSTTMMIPFTDNNAIAHNHGTNHRVWSSMPFSLLCELQTTTHIQFMLFHYIRKNQVIRTKIVRNFLKTDDLLIKS